MGMLWCPVTVLFLWSPAATRSFIPAVIIEHEARLAGFRASVVRGGTVGCLLWLVSRLQDAKIPGVSCSFISQFKRVPTVLSVVACGVP